MPEDSLPPVALAIQSYTGTASTPVAAVPVSETETTNNHDNIELLNPALTSINNSAHRYPCCQCKPQEHYEPGV